MKTTTEMKIPFVGVDAKKDDKLKALGATKIINGFADVAQVLKILAELEIYQ